MKMKGAGVVSGVLPARAAPGLVALARSLLPPLRLFPPPASSLSVRWFLFLLLWCACVVFLCRRPCFALEMERENNKRAKGPKVVFVLFLTHSLNPPRSSPAQFSFAPLSR